MAILINRHTTSPPLHLLSSFDPSQFLHRDIRQAAEPSPMTSPTRRCDSPDSTAFHLLDLTRQLSAHSLGSQRPQRRPSPAPHHIDRFTPLATSQTPTPPEDAFHCLPNTSNGDRPRSYSDYSAGSIRRQRQNALRSQCCADHLEAISALVSRMVDKGEQCEVRSARAASITRSEGDVHVNEITESPCPPSVMELSDAEEQMEESQSDGHENNSPTESKIASASQFRRRGKSLAERSYFVTKQVRSRRNTLRKDSAIA